jgi:hypothetical protein
VTSLACIWDVSQVEEREYHPLEEYSLPSISDSSRSMMCLCIPSMAALSRILEFLDSKKERMDVRQRKSVIAVVMIKMRVVNNSEAIKSMLTSSRKLHCQREESK